MVTPAPKMMMRPFVLLDWDSRCFGFPVARIDASLRSMHQLQEAIAELQSYKVSLAYWDVPATEIALGAAALRAGATFVGQRVAYVKRIADDGRPGDSGDSWIAWYPHAAESSELEGLALIAGTHSRFRTDPRFPPDRFEAMYRTWARRSVTGEIADAVLVSRMGTEHIAGMVTVTLKADEEDHCGSIGLLAVKACCRGKGHGSSLVNAALDFLRSRRHTKCKVVTQASNREACRLYERNGYQVARRDDQFHFWLS